jgi:hypothetical protein
MFQEEKKGKGRHLPESRTLQVLPITNHYNHLPLQNINHYPRESELKEDAHKPLQSSLSGRT